MHPYLRIRRCEQALPFATDLPEEGVGADAWVRLLIALVVAKRQLLDEPGVIIVLPARPNVRQVGKNLK